MFEWSFCYLYMFLYAFASSCCGSLRTNSAYCFAVIGIQRLLHKHISRSNVNFSFSRLSFLPFLGVCVNIFCGF